VKILSATTAQGKAKAQTKVLKFVKALTLKSKQMLS